MLSYAEHEDKRNLLELNVAKLAAELLQSSDVKNILLHEMSNMTLPLSNTKAKFGSLTSSTLQINSCTCLKWHKNHLLGKSFEQLKKFCIAESMANCTKLFICMQ